MIPAPHVDELAQLRAEVAAQRTALAALAARQGRPRLSLPRRLKALAAAGLLVALTPLATIAANPTFSDLGTAAAVHQPNIQAIGDAGITTGFADPDNPGQRTYNPKGLVTREEMASFLSRTAGLGGNPPVANAATAQTVPDGSVTAGKLSPTGSTAGQALVSTGPGVTWQSVVGQQGPQGAAGPKGDTGPTGPTGPTGARGPSDVWRIVRPASVVVAVAQGQYTALASVAIPAGQYTATGAVFIANYGDTESASGDCRINGNDVVSSVFNLSPGAAVVLPLVASHTTGEAWTMTIECEKFSGTPYMISGSASAIQVATFR